jgi:hypothetical protein
MFADVSSKVPTHITKHEAFERIRSDRYRVKIEFLTPLAEKVEAAYEKRKAISLTDDAAYAEAHAAYKAAKVPYDSAKIQLPVMSICGASETRGVEGLLMHNRVIHGDIDHLGNRLAEIKEQLLADPYIDFLFVSPSRYGLKMGVLVAEPLTTNEEYHHAWNVAAAYFKKTYNIVWDTAAKDISRLCFMSWDPDCYENPNTRVFDVPPMPAQGAGGPTREYECDWETPPPTTEQKAAVVARMYASRDGEQIRALYERGDRRGYTEGGCIDPNKSDYALLSYIGNHTAPLFNPVWMREIFLDSALKDLSRKPDSAYYLTYSITKQYRKHKDARGDADDATRENAPSAGAGTLEGAFFTDEFAGKVAAALKAGMKKATKADQLDAWVGTEQHKKETMGALERLNSHKFFDFLRRLQVSIVQVLLIDGEQYALVVSTGQEINIGGNLFKQQAVRETLFNELQEVATAVPQRVWEYAMQALAKAAIPVSRDSGKHRQTLVWIADFLGKLRSGGKSYAIIDRGESFVENGVPHLCLGSLLSHICRTYTIQLDRTELRNRLKKCGWDFKQFAVRDAKTQQVAKDRYWFPATPAALAVYAETDEEGCVEEEG